MRPCAIIKRTRLLNPETNRHDIQKIEVLKKGTFHCWGCDAASDADGNMNWTVGIVELADGSIEKHEPENIRFSDI